MELLQILFFDDRFRSVFQYVYRYVTLNEQKQMCSVRMFMHGYFVLKYIGGLSSSFIGSRAVEWSFWCIHACTVAVFLFVLYIIVCVTHSARCQINNC